MDWLDNIIKTFLDFDAMVRVLPQLLGTGLVNTLIISVFATVLGIVIGMTLAVMGSRVPSGCALLRVSTPTSSAACPPYSRFC